MGRKKKPTSYGRMLLARMESRGMTLWDLAQEVERRTGRFVTEEYIMGHIRGVPTPRAQTQAIREALGIPPRKEHH